jgi:hypothetical protein
VTVTGLSGSVALPVVPSAPAGGSAQCSESGDRRVGFAARAEGWLHERSALARMRLSLLASSLSDVVVWIQVPATATDSEGPGDLPAGSEWRRFHSGRRMPRL